MAGQSKLRGQKAIAFALQAPPEQLKLFYNDLMKKLRKRVKLATDCGIVAASAAIALGIGAALVSQGALLPVIVTMANTVALNGMSGIGLLFGIRKLKRRVAIVEAAIKARGLSLALVTMQT